MAATTCAMVTICPSGIMSSLALQKRAVAKYNDLRACPVLKLKAAAVVLRASSTSLLQISCLAAEPGTLSTVQKIIANQLSVDESAVTPHAKFSDLGADSLDTVEIMMNLEESFKITLGEEGAEKIVTVQDAADLIQEVISQKS